MSGVSEFEAGTERSFYLKTDGSLWASGRNTFGRLGDGTTTNRSAPVRVMASSGVAFGNVSKIASGQDHTLFLKTDGTVWACGRNETGQLGDGSGQDQPYPVQVKTSAGVNLTGATAISAGGFHSMVLTSGGTVYAFGGGYYGQLGLGNEGDLPYATQVQTGVEKISANYQNSYCLKTGGALFVTGRNFYGELGDGTTAKKTAYFQAQTGISDITTGESHLLLKKTNGSIWACGYNIYGQLGDGGTSDISTPVQVLAGSVASFDGGGSQSLFFLSDGTLSGAGYILTPTIQRLSY
jgi:alpha-tubulin suppressor-like RCC1 family protein